MTIIEIISAVLLILACVFIVAVVLMQESKQGMSNVISGGNSDNYYQRNSGRTKEAKLARATKVAAVIVFVFAIAVNVVSIYFSDSGKGNVNNIELNGALADDGTIVLDSNTADDAEETAVTDTAENEEEIVEDDAPAETESADEVESVN